MEYFQGFMVYFVINVLLAIISAIKDGECSGTVLAYLIIALMSLNTYFYCSLKGMIQGG